MDDTSLLVLPVLIDSSVPIWVPGRACPSLKPSRAARFSKSGQVTCPPESRIEGRDARAARRYVVVDPVDPGAFAGIGVIGDDGDVCGGWGLHGGYYSTGPGICKRSGRLKRFLEP